MTAQLIRTILVGLAVAGFTACTASETGEPRVAKSPGDEALAPALDQPPLKVEPFLERPCDVLTPEQAAEWTVNNPERLPAEREYTGPACDFEPDDFNRVSFGIAVQTNGGLERLYKRRDTLELFEPTEVAGYPGAFYDTADRRAFGQCALTLGATEDETLNVIVSVRDRESPEYADPCPVAARIMQQMIETIGARS